MNFTRHRMCLDLDSLHERVPAHDGVLIEPVQRDDRQRLAILELEGYRDTVDWDLVPELQTYEGCRRFFDDLFDGRIAFGGNQGLFRPDLSFKAMRGDTLCGAIYTFWTEGELLAWITSFVVAPECRGKGVGKALILHALDEYRKAGGKRVRLLVTEGNEPALGIYRKLGFEIEETFTEVV